MTAIRVFVASSFAAVVVVACSSSQPVVGQPCTAASSCYAGLDAAAIQGTPTCLTSITNGYCTHTCSSDSNCCAVSGECPSNIKEVCAPFESTGQSYCFVSCSSADISASGNGSMSPDAYCQKYAGSSFTCRSTGGGANNKQFCG